MTAWKKVILGALVTLALIFGARWWLFPRNSVTLRLLQIDQIAGQNVGTFELENRTSGPIAYAGIKGLPECHFAARETTGVITDGGPHVAGRNYAMPVQLDPGERIQFTTHLWLGSRGRPITGPFRTGVKITTSGRKSAYQLLSSLPLPRSWKADMYALVWTDEEPSVVKPAAATLREGQP